MISNEERREVAAKLRNITDWECDMCFLEEILAACVGDAYVHYSGCQLDYRLMINGLADLIEPEPERTCHFRNDGHGIMWCDTQGCDYDMDEYFPIPNYCPSCGAKVVN